MEEAIRLIFLSLPGLFFAISIHEFAHAYVADKLGDPGPREQNRLTLDPRAHISILGLLAFFFLNFGWGKPVYANPMHFKEPRKGLVAVTIAGPIGNIIGAILWGVVFEVVKFSYPHPGNFISILALVVQTAAAINVVLFVLNILPLPRFDGANFLKYILPMKYAVMIERLEQYSMIIIVLFLISGAVDYLVTIPAEFLYAKIVFPVCFQIAFGLKDIYMFIHNLILMFK